MKNLTFDSIIVGGGASGLSCALILAQNGKKVALINKLRLEECNSSYAQGGIAAVVESSDSIDAHVNDTLIAGAGLCNLEHTQHIIENSKDAIKFLLNIGVHFTLEKDSKNNFHLTQEGGHSTRRILHSTDSTGREITNTLIKNIRANPNITIFEDHIAIDLILGQKIGLIKNKCYGVYVLDKNKNHVVTFNSHDIILATGGAGKVYLYTTNPDVATGDGIAMAYRAGCNIANMEFIQFHPTCLYHADAKSFLISEAVRGEGGQLKLANGYRFMQDHDNRLELAPRDIVARAIDYEMKKHGHDCVYLDISHKSANFIIEHFPTIYETCKKYGFDITRQAIPVVPAAHYTCGGIETDLRSRTNVESLYAVGECAYTGLHGANRLASNSLLECIVTAKDAVTDILGKTTASFINLPEWDESWVTNIDEEVIISHNWDELRRAMWDYVGIVRTNKRLERAMHRINLLKAEIHDYYSNFKLSANLIELRNLVLTAELIVKSAMKRHESRGLHFSKDYPGLNNKMETTIQNIKDEI